MGKQVPVADNALTGEIHITVRLTLRQLKPRPSLALHPCPPRTIRSDHLTWRIQAKSGVHFELGEPLDGSGYQEALERNPDRP